MLKLFDSRIRKYKSIRAMGIPLMTKVGKTLPKELILQAAKDLRMLGKNGKTLIMDAENEVDFLMDRAIHDIPWPKGRWIEQICSQRIADYAPPEQAMLKAQAQAYFSLYEVSAIEAGRGLRLRDLFNGQELLLIDLGLSVTAEKGGLFATRVVTLEGLSFTSGVGTPFAANDRSKLTENVTALFEKKKTAMTWEQMMRRYAPYFFIEYKKGGHEIEFARVSAD